MTPAISLERATQIYWRGCHGDWRPSADEIVDYVIAITIYRPDSALARRVYRDMGRRGGELQQSLPGVS